MCSKYTIIILGSIVNILTGRASMITRKEKKSSLWTFINSYISVLIRKLEMAIFVICKFLPEETIPGSET